MMLDLSNLYLVLQSEIVYLKTAKHMFFSTVAQDWLTSDYLHLCFLCQRWYHFALIMSGNAVGPLFQTSKISLKI